MGGGGGGRTSGSPVWAGRSSSGSREPPKRCRGEVQVPVLDQETEAGPWGGVRRAVCGAVSGQRCVYVPYSAREGPEPEWASQKGQRMATLSKQGRKVGRFWRGSAVLRFCGAAVPASPNTHLLRLSMRAWRAFTAGRSGRACGRGRIRLATGETPSGPGQYRASSLYCEGNISGGTGGRAGGARWAGGDEKSGSGELCFGGSGFFWERTFGERPHQGPLMRIYGPRFLSATSEGGGVEYGGARVRPPAGARSVVAAVEKEDDCATYRCDAPLRSATNLDRRPSVIQIAAASQPASEPASEQYPAVGSAAVRHQCSGIPEGGRTR